MITFDIIAFTSDMLLNQYLTMFVYVTGILCSFFAAFSLMTK
jgi:uncharacterized membrane protein YqaE (UPF0057 family)